MKIIKLTSDTDGKALYVNFSHLVAFWEEGGVTAITTTDMDATWYVKETPEEILHLIEYN